MDMEFVNKMKDRTRKLAIDVIYLCNKLPNKQEYKIIANQLISSSSSTGANYRAVCRSKSTPDFINKLLIVEEEADESVYWLEVLKDLKTDQESEILRLMKEFDEVLSIIISAKQTTQNKYKKSS